MGRADEIGRGALEAFFNPASIAIIGASADETKISGRPIRNLRLGGYKGVILPINPQRSELQGLRSYPSLADVEGPVDLAIIAVPATHVLAQIEACVAKGVKAATIFSSGFAEVGGDGETIQAKMAEVATAGGMRVLGPNCMGTINTQAGVIATFTSSIVDEAPRQGRISLASQSGAFGSHCLTLMRERGLALNLWATTGNQSDVEVADFLEYMAQDPATDVVIGSIEGVRDARTLVRAFKLARSNAKPMIVMKVGRSEVGAAAMASHTASLAGSDAIFDAVLRQHGVYRAHTIDQLLDVAYACSLNRLPSNRKLGVVTLSGGVGVLIADTAADAGLEVSPLEDDVQVRMKALVPFAATRNPLDITAQILNDPGLIEPMFDMLMSEGGYGSVITFLSHVGMNAKVIEALLPGLGRVAWRYPDRFLCVSLIANRHVRSKLEAMGYAVFEDPSRAVLAIQALADFAQSFLATPPLDVDLADVPRVVRGRIYSEFEAKALLRSAGVPSADERLVTDAAAAARSASAIGFPVVLKIVSPEIAHKSEMGGVLLNVVDPDAVRAGYELILQRARLAAPEARIEGVLVAPQVKGGVETVMGVVRDPLFGPVVMFGLGGVFVEILGDVVFRPAPFGVVEAREMIGQIRGRALLDGARGAPPSDREALAQALAALSRFAAGNAEALASIDVNPMLVLAEGQGVFALDALIETLPRDDIGEPAISEGQAA